MMQLCGQCAQQVIQAAPSLAPLLWLALAAVTAVVAKGSGSKGSPKKGKGK
jgi:hypothetical protein